MNGNVNILEPSNNYKTAFAKYFGGSSTEVLSAGAIAGIVVGVILLILLIVFIVLMVYCCRMKHPRYQSAYDTDEAQGNKANSAEQALQQKLVRHPDVKHELYI
ncbi:Transmembrane protein SKG6 [Paragonimus kellicotti]|nr:Transmembrane protein SKG6 [Paragonimus kellicotti]